jgi:hypothetical protein
LSAEEGGEGEVRAYWEEVGGSSSFEAWAGFDDVFDGLGVDPTAGAAGALLWVESGCVRSDKGMACDKVDQGG